MRIQGPRRDWAIFAIALAQLAVAACSTPTWSLEGTGFAPPAKYRVLWRTTELCSGVSGDFDAVQWFVTKGSADGDEPNIKGSWYPDGNRIFLNEAHLDNEDLVRHEMLHALLRAGHQREFVGACGGVVRCVATCITEAGGLPAGPGNEAPTVRPEDLAVTIDVVAPTPGDTGWMAVIVSATNPGPTAVWVDLSARPRVEFDCRVENVPCAGYVRYGDAKGAFGAAQTRRKVTTFRVHSGINAISGGYNTAQRGPYIVIAP